MAGHEDVSDSLEPAVMQVRGPSLWTAYLYMFICDIQRVCMNMTSRVPNFDRQA